MERSQKNGETEDLKGEKIRQRNILSILKWLQKKIMENVSGKTSDIFSYADCGLHEARDIPLHCVTLAPSLEQPARDHQVAECV